MGGRPASSPEASRARGDKTIATGVDVKNACGETENEHSGASSPVTAAFAFETPSPASRDDGGAPAQRQGDEPSPLFAAIKRLSYGLNRRFGLTGGRTSGTASPAEGRGGGSRRERFLEALLETSSDCITVVDHKGRILYETPAMSESLGLEPGATVGTLLEEHILPEEAEPVRAALRSLGKRLRDACVLEFHRKRFDGRPLALEGVAVNRLDDPDVRGVAVSCRDVRERREFADELKRRALEDPITGLPNRVLFLERLSLALKTTKENPSRRFAVLFLDVDRFKLVNDSLGHSLGDKLLAEIGRRLTACVGDTGEVARFGGDEFILLTREDRDETASVKLAERIHAELSQPFAIDDREVFSSAGIGIVRVSPDYESPDHIIRDADTAMHEAKKAGKRDGKGSYRLFHARMRQRAVRRLALETDLRKALDRGEFELYYQPIVDLAKGAADGLEALIRWRHPDHGYIPPTEFIPVAEETGLILPIGEIALMRACRDLAAYNEGRPESEKLFVCVNFSARQFDRRDVALRIKTALEITGFTPDKLKIEITESAILDNPEMAAKAVNEIKELGARIAIDDFGTGYSSLSYLHRLAFDTLKIDRSFIMGLGVNGGRNDKIIRAVIGLARDLDMSVVAEGIETKSQLARLVDMRCSHGQGYLFSRPMPFAEIVPRLGALPETKRFLLDAELAPPDERRREKACRIDAENGALKCSAPIRTLARRGPVVSPRDTIKDVRLLLEDSPPMSNAAVVDGRRPVGLVMRYALDKRLSSQYGLSLYAGREATRLMDPRPLIVEGRTPIEETAAAAMARADDKIYDDVIVVENGLFLGTVSVRDMMDRLAKAHVEMAKGANPLTGLSGNVVIERELSRRSEAGIASSFLYVDLDNFKVYNDAYGFKNGDKVILLTAQILREAVKTRGRPEDFIGHVGGDDFIVITDPARAASISREICDRFGERVGALYSEEDRNRGFILGKGRDGREGEFPLASVSVGVIDCSFAEPVPMEELSRRAAEVKKCAKAMSGNSVFRDRRTPLGA